MENVTFPNQMRPIQIFQSHWTFFILWNLLGNRSIRTNVKLLSKQLQPLIKFRQVLIVKLIISRFR